MPPVRLPNRATAGYVARLDYTGFGGNGPVLLEAFAIYFCAGMLAGFVSGMFGVGGAFTMAPALIIALPLQGAPDDKIMHMAVGTSLGVMAITSVYIAVLRYRAGDLQLPLMMRFIPFIAGGALLGSLTGDLLPGIVLKTIFISFIVLTILRGIFYRGHATVDGGGDLDAVRGPGLWGYGSLTGFTGSLLGPGPAIILGPYLRGKRYPMRMVAATASALAAPLGFAATIGYVIGGFDEAGMPLYTFGYIYLPAFAGLAVGTFAGSPFGIRASHVIKDVLLHRMFISYLAFLLAVMLIYGR